MHIDDAVATPESILAYWFDELTKDDWFKRSDAVDAEIRRRFAATHLALAAGVPERWRADAEAHLAAIIVLDQLPRNIYRGTPLAFATDGLALAEARHAVDAGHDEAVGVDRRCFFYLPFEHSEALADQDRSVSLFTALGDAEYLDYALRHRDVIRQFGRFPHRNPILGRSSTPAEEDYLSKPGAGF